MSTEPIVSKSERHFQQQQVLQPRSTTTEQKASSVVFAEAQLVDSTINSDKSQSGKMGSSSLEPWRNNKAMWLVLVVLLVRGAVVVGVCGSGACSSSSSSSSSSDSSSLLVDTTPAPSLQPSLAPTLQEHNSDIYSLLNDRTLSGKQPIRPNRNDTVEERAAQWLVYEDTLDVSDNPSRWIQWYALATVWFGLDGPTSWLNTQGWVTEEDECTWFGVRCSDNSNIITELNLEENLLRGDSPTDLCLLTDLTTLELSLNEDLARTLPSAMGNMTQLEYFATGFCNIEGTLPSSIGQLSNLIDLYLYTNRFNGKVPSQIGDCVSLEYLLLVR